MITTEEKNAFARQITAIAKEAGAFITSHAIGKVTEKGDITNVVTDIDVKCQQLIIGRCREFLPDSSFLAEEEGQQQVGDGFTWVIDPIDGTTNYVYDYHHSCISIALFYQKKGLIGVVYNPYLDECFVGIEGLGSSCNGAPIHVTDHSLREALVMVGSSPYDKTLAARTFRIMQKLFLEGRDIRRSGSAALDLCYIASGRIDAFYELCLQPWDYGAGSIIVRNAGGVIEGLTENALEELNPTGIICTNGACHKAVREIIFEH